MHAREPFPSATPLRRGNPERIVRREYVRLASLGSAQRCALIDLLYGVYRETVTGITRDEFEAQVVGADVRLVLFYGADELAGFSYASIERMEHKGRNHAVFCAGVFFRLRYCGGVPSAFFGLRQALAFKIREPRIPLAYLTRSSSPAVYRLMASTIPRIYPSRRHQTPPNIETLVRALSAHNAKYVQVGECPWIVRTPATPHDASRMRQPEHAADVRFYVKLNSCFAEGQALLVWTPLDVANIIGGLFHALRAQLAH